MRPVLVELGPWQPWAIPLIALVVAGFAWLMERLDQGPEPVEEPGAAHRAVRAGLVLIVAVALYFLVNRFGPVPIRAYGFMLLVGLICGLAWMGWRGRAWGLPPAAMVDFALYILVGGIVGARVIFILTNWSLFGDAGSMFKLWEGGLSFHGGIAGGLLAVYLYARPRRLPFGLMVDLSGPAMTIGYAFTRVGCFLNGCCFGGHCTGPLGIRFGPGSEAAAWSLGLPVGQVAQSWGAPLFPAQLLASVLAAAIFLTLVAAEPHMRRRGNLFVLTLLLFGVERMVVEAYRFGASGRPWPGWPVLTVAQVFSLVLMLAAGAYLAVNWRAPRSSEEPTAKGGHE